MTVIFLLSIHKAGIFINELGLAEQAIRDASVSAAADVISEFEIVGIFDGTEGTSGNALTVDEIPANCGYIDCTTLFELFGVN